MEARLIVIFIVHVRDQSGIDLFTLIIVPANLFYHTHTFVIKLNDISSSLC